MTNPLTHASTSAALDALPPVPSVVVIANTTIELSPLRVGELPRFIAVIEPIADELAKQLAGEPNWVHLLAKHGDAVIAAMALASRREQTWIEALCVDDAIALASAVFEVNADFFIRRVTPAMTQAAARLGQTMQAAGPRPSASSSKQGTATATS